MADMIPPVGASNGTTAENYIERMPTRMLGQDDFIKILVAQLTAQDPLNPQKDAEFIGQMAQFSALESAKSMQTEIQTLRANSMIGQTVEVNAGDTPLTGVVTGVVAFKGEPKIMIDDELYSLSEVVRVERTVAPADSTAPADTNTPMAP